MLEVSRDQLIDDDAFRLLFEGAPGAYLVLSTDAPRFTIVRIDIAATGDDLDRGAFDEDAHAIAVELQLMDPAGTTRRLIDKQSLLRGVEWMVRHAPSQCGACVIHAIASASVRFASFLE
jgi:hypothetical protein